jgi:hypothetical protein
LDQTAAAALNDLAESNVFEEYAFGGSGEDCITMGAFANTTLHLKRLGTDPTDYCNARSINLSQLQQANQSYLDTSIAINNYTSG